MFPVIAFRSVQELLHNGQVPGKALGRNPMAYSSTDTAVTLWLRVDCNFNVGVDSVPKMGPHQTPGKESRTSIPRKNRRSSQ